MNGETILKKGRKNYKWINLIIVLILCICVGAYWHKEKMEGWAAPTFKNLSPSQEMKDAGECVSLDVEYMTEEVIVYGNDRLRESKFNKYHIVISDNMMYIANIDPKLMKDLQPIVDATYRETDFLTSKSKRIYAKTEVPTDEFKQLAVDAYNKIFPQTEEDKITIDDYEFIFGEMILNTRVDFVDTMIEETIIIFGILVVLFLLSIKSVLVSNKRISDRYLKKNNYEEELIKELNDEKNIKIFKDEKIFVTKNYLVDIQSGLTVIKFSDIKWLYETKVKFLGKLIGISETFYLRDGKTKIQTVEFKNKERDEFDRLNKAINKRLKEDCIKGNSKKEKEEYKNFKKSL